MAMRDVSVAVGKIRLKTHEGEVKGSWRVCRYSM
jgi:hypothetical protein